MINLYMLCVGSAAVIKPGLCQCYILFKCETCMESRWLDFLDKLERGLKKVQPPNIPYKIIKC